MCTCVCGCVHQHDSDIDTVTCSCFNCSSNININDVLGDYSLTLVDTLDTLAVMGDRDEFKRAVQLVIKHVDFSTCSTVQVFEATIRCVCVCVWVCVCVYVCVCTLYMHACL